MKYVAASGIVTGSNPLVMKPFQFILFFVFIGLSTSAFAQRDAATSSARAAYSTPSTGFYKKEKKKNKSRRKVQKRSKTARKAKKSEVDAARERRRSLSF